MTNNIKMEHTSMIRRRTFISVNAVLKIEMQKS